MYFSESGVLLGTVPSAWIGPFSRSRTQHRGRPWFQTAAVREFSSGVPVPGRSRQAAVTSNHFSAHHSSWAICRFCICEEMTSVTTRQVQNWICFKTFGKMAILSTDQPNFCWRWNMLAQMKKCSCHYFPNKMSQWMNRKGNLTKSQCGHEVISLVYTSRSARSVLTCQTAINARDHSDRMSFIWHWLFWKHTARRNYFAH